MKLYAGGFARFFLGDWPHDREEDEDFDDGEEAASPDDVRLYFEAFRDTLGTDLKQHGTDNVTWSEAATGAHAVEDVSADEFSALLIIAARAHVADKRMIPINLNKDWFDDPAVVQVQDADQNFLPIHHLVKADTWLPADFEMLVESEVPERDLIIGSIPQLTLALMDLEKILNTPNEVTRKLPSSLVTNARRAQEALTKVAQWALKERAPILIDP